MNTPNASSARQTLSKGRVLTVNGGSSSIKFALFDPGDPPTHWLGGAAQRFRHADASLHVAGVDRSPERRPLAAAGAARAATELLDWLENDRGGLGGGLAVGHWVVYGGPARFDPQPVTPELLADLERAVPLDPNHLPAEIALIEALARRLPGVPQVACFDTSFHRDLPSSPPGTGTAACCFCDRDGREAKLSRKGPERRRSPGQPGPAGDRRYLSLFSRFTSMSNSP